MLNNFYILQWWDFLALILIFIIGIPHGAFDVAVGTSIGILNSYKTKLLFIFSPFVFFPSQTTEKWPGF